MYSKLLYLVQFNLVFKFKPKKFLIFFKNKFVALGKKGRFVTYKPGNKKLSNNKLEFFYVIKAMLILLINNVIMRRFVTSQYNVVVTF